MDGFKIDGGDAKYQPDPAQTAWHENVGASGYVDLLLETFEEIAPGCCESRTAWLSPQRNILWREGGKDSHWGVDNGLKAVVNLGLHLALIGYDTLIADMIPGRIQTMVSTLPLPTDELFIRWTEASALMPIMQFSYFPWNYAEATSHIARSYAQLHKALEDHRTAIRNVRRDGVEAIRKATKDKKITEDDEKKSLDELQKLTDGEIKKMEDMCKVKEKEIMSV